MTRMDTVWLVTVGLEGDDYSVVAVCATREVAESLVATRPGYYNTEIEERSVLSSLPVASPVP